MSDVYTEFDRVLEYYKSKAVGEVVCSVHAENDALRINFSLPNVKESFYRTVMSSETVRAFPDWDIVVTPLEGNTALQVSALLTAEQTATMFDTASDVVREAYGDTFYTQLSGLSHSVLRRLGRQEEPVKAAKKTKAPRKSRKKTAK